MNSKLLLILICIFFFITRFYKITEIPPSVYWDEASIGYNAFSLAQTGKDEWGDFLPIHFRAFGEFKLPVYIYSAVPFVKIFGLNGFSVRAPSVLFSLGVVILIYLLAKRLSGSQLVGLFSSFFITISPWFFIFSRTGFEVTAGLMFYLAAVYLFLLTPKNGIFLLFSTASFILSAYSYNSFRIIAPLTILILILLEKDHLKDILRRQSKWVILSSAIIIIIIWPIYRLYMYDVGFFRLQAVGTVTAPTFIKNYIAHFNLDFLLGGDKNLRHHQRGFGQVYLPEPLLLLFGFLYLIGSKSKYGLLALLLLLIGPIPAALTKESPHALRSLSVVPFLSMISAIGILYTKKFIKAGYLIEITVVIVFLGLFTQYFFNFLNVYPNLSSKDWQYGYKKFFKEYKDEFVKYNRVIVSDKYAQPYIFALFYLKYDPQKFRLEVIRNSVDQWGFSTVAKFGKFEFGKVDELLKEGEGKTLIFASENEVYER